MSFPVLEQPILKSKMEETDFEVKDDLKWDTKGGPKGDPKGVPKGDPKGDPKKFMVHCGMGKYCLPM
jgi:hypothetical protein